MMMMIPENPLCLLGKRLYRLSGNVRKLSILDLAEVCTLWEEYRRLLKLAETLMCQFQDEISATRAQQLVNPRRLRFLIVRHRRALHLRRWLMKVDAVLDRRVKCAYSQPIREEGR